MGAIISRFAPAPTGFLHLGHVVNALWVWQTADRVLLRIEDHDRQRSRPEFEDAIVEDLDWLGFVPTAPRFDSASAETFIQQALETLKHQQLVYGCSCSRGDVARALQARDRDPERVALRTSDDLPLSWHLPRQGIRGCARYRAAGTLRAVRRALRRLRHGPHRNSVRPSNVEIS
jgi:glutamyl/glutaminyl-tRNA synthetase